MGTHWINPQQQQKFAKEVKTDLKNIHFDGFDRSPKNGIVSGYAYLLDSPDDEITPSTPTYKLKVNSKKEVIINSIKESSVSSMIESSNSPEQIVESVLNENNEVDLKEIKNILSKFGSQVTVEYGYDGTGEDRDLANVEIFGARSLDMDEVESELKKKGYYTLEAFIDGTSYYATVHK